MQINGGDFLFPVFNSDWSKKKENGAEIIPEIYGTSFHVGKGLFVTAAHVITSVLENGEIVIGKIHEGKTILQKPTSYGVDEGKDVGYFFIEDWGFLPAYGLNGMKSSNLKEMLEEVTAIGFPFAVDSSNKTLSMRAFNGHIVSQGILFDLKDKPQYYELSFSAPKGLSGAPIFQHTNEIPNVIGMVLGTKETAMEMVTYQEEISSEKHLEVVRYKHFLQLGVGLHVNEIGKVRLNSRRKTIQDFIFGQ